MTAKHFQAFAEKISTIRSKTTRLKMAIMVAEVCQEQNAKFDLKRFYKACDVTP